MKIDLDAMISDRFTGNPPSSLGRLMATAVMMRMAGGMVEGQEAQRREKLADQLAQGGTIEIDATTDGALIMREATAGMATYAVAALHRAFNP